MPRDKIVAFGNCQAWGIAQCAGAALGAEVAYVNPSALKAKRDGIGKAFSNTSLIFASTGPSLKRVKAYLRRGDGVRVVAVPRLFFNGFHPDVVYPDAGSAAHPTPLGRCNSALLVAAWRTGLTSSEAITLFRDEVFAALGYYEAFSIARQALLQECAVAGFDAGKLFDKWAAVGTFMYQPLHPHLSVLRDITAVLLEREGLWSGGEEPIPQVDDELARNVIWPVYPEIAHRLGVSSDYLFRPKNTAGLDRADLAAMDLKAFVRRSYAIFEEHPPEPTAFERLKDPRFDDIERFARTSRPGSKQRRTPYSDLADFHWWSKSVARQEMAQVDPVVRPKFRIKPATRIATAGSCFAQHIARRLQKENYNYLVTEAAPSALVDEAENYGTFTARYGNVYTTRQLVQLVDRAYGRLHPNIEVWPLSKGGYVDPFRPRISSRPFETVEQLNQERERHFVAVREMFETLDVFVFTLGLTEAWWAATDHVVIPLPPSVVGADVPDESYAPTNLSVLEVMSDLEQFVEMLKQINREAKVLLTVSPVPLIATMEDQHVLTASTYSKAVLRSAAGEVASRHEHVAYFPSYEIVSGSFTRGAYFADDLRDVTPQGVDHVMRLFMRHYAGQETESTELSRPLSEIQAGMDIICDEEAIGENASQVA